jgi:chemotaxis protein MotB
MSLGVSRQQGKTTSHLPVTTAMLARLERLEAEESSQGGPPSHGSHGPNRWMISYADMVTLLLGLFLLLFAVSQKNNQELSAALDALAAKLALKPPAVLAIDSALSESAAGEPLQAPLPESSSSPALDAALAEALPGQAVEVSRQERGTVISLSDNILFAPGSDALAPAAQRTLDTLAQALRAQNRPIRVEGHTDNTPIRTARFPSNWELSTARATAIVRYWIARHGFSTDRLSASGYGEFRPVANNSTIEGKRKNRRVDIVLLSPQASLAEPATETPAKRDHPLTTLGQQKEPAEPTPIEMP